MDDSTTVLKKKCPNCDLVLRIKPELSRGRFKCSNCRRLLSYNSKSDALQLEARPFLQPIVPHLKSASASDIAVICLPLGTLMLAAAYFGVLGRIWSRHWDVILTGLVATVAMVAFWVYGHRRWGRLTDKQQEFEEEAARIVDLLGDQE